MANCNVIFKVGVKTVFTMERFNKLLDKAKKNIAKLKIKNVNYKLGNGFERMGR